MALSPITRENKEGIRTYLEVFTQMDFEKDIHWDTTAGFMEYVESKGLLLNTALLAPHGVMRISAAGLSDRLCRPEEIAPDAPAALGMHGSGRLRALHRVAVLSGQPVRHGRIGGAGRRPQTLRRHLHQSPPFLYQHHPGPGHRGGGGSGVGQRHPRTGLAHLFHPLVRSRAPAGPRGVEVAGEPCRPGYALHPPPPAGHGDGPHPFRPGEGPRPRRAHGYGRHAHYRRIYPPAGLLSALGPDGGPGSRDQADHGPGHPAGDTFRYREGQAHLAPPR